MEADRDKQAPSTLGLLAADNADDTPQEEAYLRQSAAAKNDAVRAETLQFEPWLRLNNEPARAWRAFVAYRDLGSRRSLGRAATIAEEKAGTLATWSARWQWAYRCEMFDRDIARRAAEESIEAHKQMMVRHVGISMALQEKALLRLKTMDISELTPLDVIRFVKESVRIERLARGEPTEITETLQTNQPDTAGSAVTSFQTILDVLREAGALPPDIDMNAMAGVIDGEYAEVEKSNNLETYQDEYADTASEDTGEDDDELEDDDE